jgi:hypothetical protein
MSVRGKEEEGWREEGKTCGEFAFMHGGFGLWERCVDSCGWLSYYQPCRDSVRPQDLFTIRQKTR